MIKFNFTLILLCLVFLAHAQVPQKFNYQGIARDVNGNPIANQQMSIQLEILPSLESTKPAYQETQTITTNEFGLYTLQIGNGIPAIGTMKSVKWETGNQYIHVRIDPTGGNKFVEAGTTQLLSVPYALYADQAGVARESLNGNSQNTTRATNNYIEKTSSTGVANSTSLLYDNGTSIGLGTTTPTARFQISQNIASVQEHLRMQNSSTTGAGRFTMYNDGTSSYATFTKYGSTYGGGYAGIPTLYPYANLLAFGNNGLAANDGLGRFLISSGGNIGISIAKSSTSKLKFHIDYATENVGIGGNSVPVSRVHLNNSDGTTMDLNLTNNTTGHTAADGLQIRNVGNVASITNKENDVLTLGTNNTTRMTVTAAGNVELANQIRIAGGAPGSGKVLTSDATGLATWQTPSGGGGGGGFFQVSPANSNHIIYTNASNYGKNFIVNADSVNYDGSGLDGKMMFIPSKYAFRAGLINTTNWDIDSIGLYSIGLGAGPRAKGDHAVALGTNTIASGLYSTAMGATTIASGLSSTAMGSSTNASGQTATAMGANTSAIGQNSTTMGAATTASGYSSTAMGAGTIASGSYATSMGTTTNATGDGSIAMGDGATASGIASVAMGYHTTAYSSGSTAMGNFTSSSGQGSTAMGASSNASGQAATSMGEYATALGRASTAMGYYPMASAYSSTAIGYFTKAKSFAETSIGHMNDTLSVTNPDTWSGDSNRLFTIGNGTSSNARSTAFVVQQNGNVGVGVRVPQSKLHINGQIKITDGTQGAGKVLTSDANGLATWQTVAGGGGGLPAGTAQQTLFHDGTNWVANSALLNDGTQVGIGIGPSNAAPLTFANIVGKKINFYPAQPDGYCMGVEASDLRFAGGISGGDAITFRTQGYNGAERMRIAGNGNIGIGTNAPTALLSVNGTANNTTGAWGVFSDIRVKKVNADFTDGLNVIKQIHTVKFNYNENAPFKAEGEQIGVIAQELEKIAPYMISTKAYGSISDLREVNNQAYTFLLINAVKELSMSNDKLITANEEKNQAIEELKNEIAEIKALLKSQTSNPEFKK